MSDSERIMPKSNFSMCPFCGEVTTVDHKLRVGNFYWIRQKAEKIWRPAYIGYDSDDHVWISILGLKEPLDEEKMDLSCFDFVKLEFPKDGYK